MYYIYVLSSLNISIVNERGETAKLLRCHVHIECKSIPHDIHYVPVFTVRDTRLIMQYCMWKRYWILHFQGLQIKHENLTVVTFTNAIDLISNLH